MRSGKRRLDRGQVKGQSEGNDTLQSYTSRVIFDEIDDFMSCLWCLRRDGGLQRVGCGRCAQRVELVNVLGVACSLLELPKSSIADIYTDPPPRHSEPSADPASIAQGETRADRKPAARNNVHTSI
jgi:hypothetical protein